MSETTAADLADEEALGRRVRTGLAWSFVNNVAGRMGTMLAGIVLARILVPEDYGVFAVALVALNAVLSMNELGVSLAVVREKGPIEEIAPTVTTVALVTSGALYTACFLLAPAVASALDTPEATGVLRLLCVGVLIDGVAAVPAAQITRAIRQDQRMVIDLVTFVITTTLSVWLAVAGFGAWSLAWGRLAGNAVGTVLFFLMVPVRYRPGWNRERARALLAFGLPLAGSSVIVFAILNVDYIVVGSVLGPEALGLYLLAFNLSSWPVNMFSSAVRRVSLAGFSQLEDDRRVRAERFAHSLGLLMAVTIPICVLLGLLAWPAVTFVYGDEWTRAASALQFLAVLGAMRVAQELAYDFLVALGRSRAIFVVQATWLVVLGPALIVGARFDGIRGAAVAHAVVAVAVVTPAFAVVLRRNGVSLKALATSLRRPLAGAALVTAAAALGLAVSDEPFLRLAVGGTLGLAGYAVVVLPMRHDLRGTEPERSEA